MMPSEPMKSSIQDRPQEAAAPGAYTRLLQSMLNDDCRIFTSQSGHWLRTNCSTASVAFAPSVGRLMLAPDCLALAQFKR